MLTSYEPLHRVRPRSMVTLSGRKIPHRAELAPVVTFIAPSFTKPEKEINNVASVKTQNVLIWSFVC